MSSLPYPYGCAFARYTGAARQSVKLTSSNDSSAPHKAKVSQLQGPVTAARKYGDCILERFEVCRVNWHGITAQGVG